MKDRSKSLSLKKKLIKAAKIVFSTMLGMGMLLTVRASASDIWEVPKVRKGWDAYESWFLSDYSTSDTVYPAQDSREKTVARGLCLSGEYESAIMLYEDMLRFDPENKEYLINLGYAYAHKTSPDTDASENIEKAIEYYELADCAEGRRNLLILYLAQFKVKESGEVLSELLKEKDEITLSYLKKTLVDTNIMTKKDLKADNASFIITKLIELTESGMFFISQDLQDIPDDTAERHYVYCSPGWDRPSDEESSQFFFMIYVRRWRLNADTFESLYYTEKGILKPCPRVSS